MAGLSKEQKRFLEAATLRYAKHLDDALPYLTGRALDPELLRAEGLGVVRNPLPGHEQFEGWLAIPYLTDAGPVNMRFRCMQDHDHDAHHHSKYMMMKGYQGNLYGVQQYAVAEDWICVCEGELDALSLRQAGLPAFGVPGSTMWKKHWLNVFEDFSYVYIFTDGDAAGDRMWKHWSDAVSDRTATIRVKLPHKEDANSILQSKGEAYLRGLVKR